jgi:hypothetical protein
MYIKETRMPSIALTDDDVLTALDDAGRALTVTQVLDAINLRAGTKARVSRSTAISHLRRLVDARHVVRLTLADAPHYGGSTPKQIPRTAFYITAQHRRAWDSRRISRRVPVAVAVDTLPNPVHGQNLIDDIDNVLSRVRENAGIFACDIRTDLVLLRGQLAAACPLLPHHAVVAREKVTWLTTLAGDLESVAEAGAEADALVLVAPTSSPREPEPQGADRAGESAEQLQAFQFAVFETSKEIVAGTDETPPVLPFYVVLPGFLASLDRQPASLRPALLRAVVKVLTRRSEESHQPRQAVALRRFAASKSTPMTGLWAVSVSRHELDEVMLVWRVRRTKIVEMVEVVSRSRVDFE